MRVFVAGAGGAIGRPLLRLLYARGHDVVATPRTPQKLDGLRAFGAEPVVMDGLDAGSGSKRRELAQTRWSWRSTRPAPERLIFFGAGVPTRDVHRSLSAA
jgi:nucleoside-diphosphate-sugar epimerase